MSRLFNRRPAITRPARNRPTSKLRRHLPMEALERRNLMAVVATEFPDYAPGETANIFASGFEAGEAVVFQVLHNDGTPNTGNGHLPWTVVDGSAADLDGLADGNVHTTWYVDPDDSNWSSFDLNATGQHSGLFAHNTFTDAGSTLSQFANKPATNYQTGSLNAINSSYTEGNSIPFRYLISDLQEGANVVLDIIYQFQSSASGPRTYDFLTSDAASQTLTDSDRFGATNASKPAGFGLTSSTNLLLVAIPDDTGIGTDTGGFFRVASNVPVSLVSIASPVVAGNPNEKMIRMVLHLGNDSDATPAENIVDLGVFWGGHLARDNDYAGTDNGAADAPGASFHMRTEGFHDINGNGTKDSGDDSLGGGDRSIQGGVVVSTSLAWEKRRADNNQLLGGATFLVTPNPVGGAGSFTVTDNGLGDADPDAGQLQLNDIAFGTYSITEVVPPPGFTLEGDVTRVQAVTIAAPVAVIGIQGQDDPGSSDESDFHNLLLPPANPQIAIDKVTVDGAVSGDFLYPLAGESIGWRYTVTNAGNVALGNITVTDNQPGVTPVYQSGDTNSNGLLDLGEAWVYFASGTAVVGDYTNEGVASGTFTNGSGGVITVMDGDTSSYFGADPQISIDKVTQSGSASGDGISVTAGAPVTWQYTVRAVGNVSLALITVTDNQPGVTPTYQSGDTNSNDILDKEETWIYTATGTAIAGAYSNTGTASGKFTDQSGHIYRDFASDDSSYFGAAPAIMIDKVTVDGAVSGDGIYVLAGESIGWRYTVTNAGNVALGSITVTDNQPGVTPVYQSGDTNSNGLLDLGEAWVYFASGTAVVGDYTNEGVASGRFTDGSGGVITVMDGDTSSYFGADPQISIDKVTLCDNASGDGITVMAGETVTWQYTVRAVGNVSLALITVTDNQPGVTPTYQSGDTNSNDILDKEETWIYTATGTAIAGAYSNTGTASGKFTDQSGHIFRDFASDDSSYFGAAPAINVDKVTVDAANVGDSLTILAGEPINWRYTVTNTGNVALANVAVTDNQPGVTPVYQSGDVNSNGLLDLGEAWVYTAAGTSIAGAYANTATATGRFTDDCGEVANVSDGDDSSYFGAAPGIAIDKVTVDASNVGDGLTILAGEPISWRYTVTNTGNVALANVTVTDSKPGVSPVYQSGDVNSNGLLDLSEVWVYTATGTSLAGAYANTGTANGRFADGAGHVANVSDADDSSYFGAAPGIDINKVTVDGPISGDGLTILAGESISWRYTVTNTGNVALANVAVTDNQPGVTPVYQSGDVNSNGLLDLGEAWVYTATGTSLAGAYANTGTANGRFADGAGHVANVSDGDDSSYFGAAPGVAVNKVTVSGATVGDGITVRTGDPITWRYTVTNTGNVALGNIAVTDNMPGVAPVYQSGDANSNGQLDLGESWIFTAAGVATTGVYNNVGKVTGNATDSAGHVTMAMATDGSSYFGHRDIIVIGPDKQNTATSLVRVVDRATGQQISQFYAYEPNFRGGVRLATGDMDGDGIDEIITAPGRSRAPEVRVFRQDGTELTKFRTMAYASTFMGGVEVAVGDVNGDGRNDIVTVPTAGATQARVFFNNYNPANPNADPIANNPNKQFSVFASNFQGGADVALADVGTFSNGTTVNATTPDGKAELIIGNGPGMRSTIYVYDVTGATPKVVDTILPFDNNFKGGITLDTARVNGDQIPDIIVSAGNGGQSRVQVFSGLTNDAVDAVLSNFQAFGNTSTKNAPVHTTAVDVNNDGIADLFVEVQGTDGTSNQIRTFNLNGTPAATLGGFNGSWNIARLRRPLPRLVDAVFARLN